MAAGLGRRVGWAAALREGFSLVGTGGGAPPQTCLRGRLQARRGLAGRRCAESPAWRRVGACGQFDLAGAPALLAPGPGPEDEFSTDEGRERGMGPSLGAMPVASSAREGRAGGPWSDDQFPYSL